MDDYIKCIECKKSINIKLPEYCFDCSPSVKSINKLIDEIEFNKNLFEKKLKQNKNKWTLIKEISYLIILSFIPVYFIGIKYGIEYQIFYVFGQIYVTILPKIVFKLSRIF